MPVAQRPVPAQPHHGTVPAQLTVEPGCRRADELHGPRVDLRAVDPYLEAAPVPRVTDVEALSALRPDLAVGIGEQRDRRREHGEQLVQRRLSRPVRRGVGTPHALLSHTGTRRGPGLLPNVTRRRCPCAETGRHDRPSAAPSTPFVDRLGQPRHEDRRRGPLRGVGDEAEP